MLKNKLPTEVDTESLGPERHRTAAVTALILFVVVAVGYLCSPVDLVPDTIPVIGWLDDLIAGLLSTAGAAVAASYLEGYELREWRMWVPALLRHRVIRWGLVAVVAVVLVAVVLIVLTTVVVVVWPLVAPGQSWVPGFAGRIA
jgi:uncharacterized membrane protein YkvA (DUF1232 family)